MKIFQDGGTTIVATWGYKFAKICFTTKKCKRYPIQLQLIVKQVIL